MRTLVIAGLLLLIATAPLSTREGQAVQDKAAQETCQLTIELADAKSGHALPGIVSVRDEDDKRVHLPGLVQRGRGVGDEYSIHDWYVLPQPATVAVPRKKLKLKAFYGLETEFGEATLDLRDKKTAKVKIPLKRFYDAHNKGLQSANTHVHLMKIKLKESDRYLLEVARAEQLDIVYISYLERAKADLEYTTNKYSLKDLKRLTEQSHKHHHHHHGPGGHHHHHHHTEFDNGQEHRHNFLLENQRPGTAGSEGYGHVMLLHLPELIQPVSIGQGLAARGNDGIPLRRGIDKARGLGSTVIWCHNAWGLEDIPNWLSGKLQANNIFDGGTHGSYKHSFYRYLNAGLKVPFSTGTDWFIYDFSRVYVVADKGVGKGKYLNSEQWLKHLAAGRCYITNGPLLEFTANGKRLGDTLDVKAGDKVKLAGRAIARNDFQRIELIRDGKVIHTAASKPLAGHFLAELDLELPITAPCWLALRTPPPSADSRFPELQRKTPLNEYGRELFSHTSAIYLTLAGQSIFHRPAAEALFTEMKKNRAFIRGRADFGNEKERKEVLGVYDQAIAEMEKRLRAAE